MRQKRLVNLLLAAGFTVALCLARKPGEPIRPGFNLFSKQQDVELGQQAAAQVRQKVTVVQNQFLQDYVQRVGKRLTAQPEATGWPFTFTVILDPSINAFAPLTQSERQPALITMLASKSALTGGPETDALLTISRPDGLFYLVFIAPASEFKDLEDVYNEVVQSVRFK